MTNVCPRNVNDDFMKHNIKICSHVCFIYTSYFPLIFIPILLAFHFEEKPQNITCHLQYTNKLPWQKHFCKHISILFTLTSAQKLHRSGEKKPPSANPSDDKKHASPDLIFSPCMIQCFDVQSFWMLDSIIKTNHSTGR